MTPADLPRARLTVVAGFLGAGKSTWLRHHLREGVFQGALAVVNEAAAAPVDDQMLGGPERPLVLAGGCACCERLPALIALLREVGESRAAATAPVERLVLETSGLADPAAIATAVRGDPSLARWLDLGETVVLVGADTGLELLGREPLARRQVAGADALILSRLDQADPAATAALAGLLEVLVPGVPMFGAVQGVETPLPSPHVPSSDLLGSLNHAAAGEPPIQAVTVRLGEADWTIFSLWLSALLQARGADVLRVKGVVATPAGRLLLQAIGAAVQAPELLPGAGGAEDGTVVVIGRNLDGPVLQASLDRLSALADRS